MLDALLFAVLPYAALALVAGVPFVRHFSSPGRVAALPDHYEECKRLYRGSPAWRGGVTLLVTGHLLAFLLPRQVAWLIRSSLGLALLEIVAFVAGLLALVGLGRLLREGFRGEREVPCSTLLGGAAATLFLTLVAVAIASGLTMALVYRWGSAWYQVTLVPYLHSLVRGEPEVALAADLPPLVKLHLLAGLSSLAVLPFTRFAAALVWPFGGLGLLPAALRRRRAAAGARGAVEAEGELT